MSLMDRVGGVEFHGDETEELLDHFRARLLLLRSEERR